MSEEKTSISFKLGGAEFSAEGPVSVVNAQFDAFLKALSDTPARTPEPDRPDTPGHDGDKKMPPPGMVDAALINRVFSNDGDRVSLKALPKSGAEDALLLLLYGFEAVFDEHSVTGSALMKAAEKSGVRIDRVDRHLAGHELVTSAGARRAKRYGLNNRGKAHAEKLLLDVIG